MYWYMTTKTASRALLTDETWDQIPSTHADRRVVGAALLVMGLVVAAIIGGNAAGVLVPHFAYEGGSTTAVPRTHSLRVNAIIHNDTSRSWRIIGATINAPGTSHEIVTTNVNVPAHETRSVVGVVHVDDCLALTPERDSQGAVSYDITLRVERLFGASTFTIDGVSEDVMALACRG